MPSSRPLLPAPARRVAVLALAVALAGCSSLPSLPSLPAWPSFTNGTDDLFGLITPYRIDIIQGNVVTKEQLAALKPGLRRDQVRNLLGTPLLTSAFHADRWDYVFTIRRQGTEPQRRSIVLTFKGDRLETIEAPEVPDERTFVASISSRKDLPPSDKVLELTDEQRKALPKPAAPPAAASAPQPQGVARTYPPLE